MARHRRNPLGRYGFPSERELIAQALGLARASVPTPGSIKRQYGRASSDVAGFSNALVELLKAEKGAAGNAYQPSIDQAQAANAAAQQRLAALGPEYAVAGGAANDTALNQLLANQGAAAAYGAKQPGIAAGRGAVARIGIQNAMLDAMQQRREALRSAFMQAYPQVRSQALAEATAGADIRQNNRAFHEGVRQYNLNHALDVANLNQGQASDNAQAQQDAQKAFYAARNDARDFAASLFTGPSGSSSGSGGSVLSGGGGGGGGGGYKPPSWDKAYQKVWGKYAPELLHVYGLPRRQVARMIRKALIDAGFKKPPKLTASYSSSDVGHGGT